MLNKFSFVNEEILRSQIHNELANFTNRDKLVDQRLMNTLTNFTGYLPHNGNQFNQSNYLNPSQTKYHNHSQSFDNDFVDTYDNDTLRKKATFAVSKPTDAMQMLRNPNYFWSNNGVAYEFCPIQNFGGMLSAK